MSAYDIYAPGSAEEPGGQVPARGVDPGDHDPKERASFIWVDEETGEELAVIVRGDEAFFRELESIGFARRDEAAGSDENDSRKVVPESFRKAGPAEGPRQSPRHGEEELNGNGADWQGRQPA